MTISDDIHIRKSGKAGHITLTRPHALNAMSYDMCLAIEQALIEWRDDFEVKLVIIDAQGERSFCAGGDIQDLYDTGKAGDFEFGRKFWADEYRVNILLADYPKPYVAIMDGIVMGGGVGISAHGSHRIVTENTLFAMPECGIGLVPDVGACSILAKAPSNIGKYIGLSGARMKAADTIYSGFADTFVSASKLSELIESLTVSGNADEIGLFASEPEEGFLAEKENLIASYFSHSSSRGIVRSLETSGDDWCLAQAKLMRRGCPLSIACAHEIISQVAKEPTVQNSVRWEYRFTFRSMSHGEFIEGVRAQIIDKDRKPQWQTATLEAVTEDQIKSMLAPLGERELGVS